jgi:hypothetical protein
MATIEIERINRKLEVVDEDLEAAKKSLNAGGLSEAMEIALRKNIDSYEKARLEDKITELEGSAPSGNTINHSQSLHRLFECVLVVSLPVPSPPRIEAPS